MHSTITTRQLEVIGCLYSGGTCLYEWLGDLSLDESTHEPGTKKTLRKCSKIPWPNKELHPFFSVILFAALAHQSTAKAQDQSSQKWSAPDPRRLLE